MPLGLLLLMLCLIIQKRNLRNMGTYQQTLSLATSGKLTGDEFIAWADPAFDHEFTPLFVGPKRRILRFHEHVDRSNKSRITRINSRLRILLVDTMFIL